MARKSFKFNAMVVVHDPSKDNTAVLDNLGMVVMPPETGKRYIKPGETVQLEEEEGNRLLKIVGPYREFEYDKSKVRF